MSLTRFRIALPAALAAAAAVAGGCGSELTAPPEAVFQISPERQWAGGVVEITSPVLAEGRGPALAFAPDDTLTVVESRPEGLQVRLPEDANGPLEIRVSVGGATYTAGSVDTPPSTRSMTPKGAAHRLWVPSRGRSTSARETVP